jgi:nucleoside-diphosphate-sugar epimerase
MVERTTVALVGADGWIGRRFRSLAPSDVAIVAIGRRHSPADDYLVARDGAELSNALAGVRADVVVNCAGRQHGSEDLLHRDNVDLVELLLATITDQGSRLIQIGSAAEYGDQGTASPIKEEAPAEPTSPYGRSKLAATELVLQARRAGAHATVLRLFNLAGPEQPQSSPVGQFAESVLRLPIGGGVVEVGNPELVRDYVSLDFAVACVLAAIDKSPSMAVINVCSGRGMTFGALVQTLGRHAGRAVDVHSQGWDGIGSVVGDPTIMTTELAVRLGSDDLDRALEQVIATAKARI